jgi:hypothetical protein
VKVGKLVRHKRGWGNSNIGVVLGVWRQAARVYWFDYKITEEYHNDDLEEICK